MTLKEAQIETAKIIAMTDPAEKCLAMSSLVISILRERTGAEYVVVGGSAIELLTDGRYVSGDIDLAWENKGVGLRDAADIFTGIGATGGPRSWNVGGIWIDLLGQVETVAKTDFPEIEGPYGKVKTSKVEDLLAERILMASYPQRNEQAEIVAKKLMAVSLRGNMEVDWNEALAVAENPLYKVGKEFQRIEEEVKKQLGNPTDQDK